MGGLNYFQNSLNHLDVFIIFLMLAAFVVRCIEVFSLCSLSLHSVPLISRPVPHLSRANPSTDLLSGICLPGQSRKL